LEAKKVLRSDHGKANKRRRKAARLRIKNIAFCMVKE